MVEFPGFLDLPSLCCLCRYEALFGPRSAHFLLYVVLGLLLRLVQQPRSSEDNVPEIIPPKTLSKVMHQEVTGMPPPAEASTKYNFIAVSTEVGLKYYSLEMPAWGYASWNPPE